MLAKAMRRNLLALALSILCVSAPAIAQFQFARLNYGVSDNSMYPTLFRSKGWITDYEDGTTGVPHMETRLVELLNRVTALRASETITYPNITDLGNTPFIYTVEPEQMALTTPQQKAMREWLKRGGFWMMDDFHGCAEADHVWGQLHSILYGDGEWKVLTADHEIFHTLYNIPEILQVPLVTLGQAWAFDHTQPLAEAWPPCDKPVVYLWEGGNHDGTILLAYNQDLGDGLEHIETYGYPVEFSVYAYEFFANVILYAISH